MKTKKNIIIYIEYALIILINMFIIFNYIKIYYYSVCLLKNVVNI